MLTKSDDDCIVIVKSKDKSHKTDVFLSNDTLKHNVSAETFIKHKTLSYNGNSVYILKEDM
jgi:hypothetical protein